MNSVALQKWNPGQKLTLTALRALVESVDLSKAPFKLWFQMHEWRNGAGDESLNVQLSWVVPDRNTGDPVTIHHFVHLYPGMGSALAIQVLGSAVETAFTHEFKECFTVGGVRIYDPHPQEKWQAEFQWTSARETIAPATLVMKPVTYTATLSYVEV